MTAPLIDHQLQLMTGLLKNSTPREAIYHYKTQAGFLGILDSRSIRCTDMRFLNDTRELSHARDLADGILEKLTPQASEPIKQLYRGWRSTIQTLPQYPMYVTSFSEERDLLSQWRAYGHGGGYALGFQPIDLMRRIGDGVKQGALPGVLVKCEYDLFEQQASITDAIEYLTRAFAESDPPESPESFARHFFGYLLIAAACFKHPSFAEEKEWRLILRTRAGELDGTRRDFREGKSTLIPYVQFGLALPDYPIPLREVVVGPTSQLALACEAARQVLSDLKPRPDVTVAASTIPFRDW